MDIKNSKAAWTGDLPHSWENQIAARNNGTHDNWLEAKRSGRKEYQDLPLTLGYYTREDIPFYYALADASTICDQHFCASITGTTTNRHFFWTGTCVPERGAKPLVRNSDTYYNKLAKWKTFPERLEETNISWKVYQNEISLHNELNGETESWLGNFTDNNLEWFDQYQVRFKKSHIDYYQKRLTELPDEIEVLKKQIDSSPSKDIQKPIQQLKQKQEQIIAYQKEVDAYSQQNFASLSDFSQALHQKAFTTNEGDPDYHSLTTVKTDVGQEIQIPKGDVLHQFRNDVKDKNLPTVSWLVAPQNFSDHPSAPMYGAWYVSEVLKILTDHPEVWKKTIFIINYDENDGYFDHIPPFVAPNPDDPTSGKTSATLDYSAEYVSKSQELASGVKEEHATAGPVGLGYRVPLFIVSPWSKGGWVNSEVCDISSTLKFLEYFIEKKYGKKIVEENISSWRRAISGNLTPAFRPYNGEKINLPAFLRRHQHISAIHAAKELPTPNGYKKFEENELVQVQKKPLHHPLLPSQEKGIRPSNGLNYELYVDSLVDKSRVNLRFTSATELFKERSLAAPYLVYTGSTYQTGARSWSFATNRDTIEYEWPLEEFKNNHYQLHAYGPNGFYRRFEGSDQDPQLTVYCTYEQNNKAEATGNIILKIKNTSLSKVMNFSIKSNAYHAFHDKHALPPQSSLEIKIDNQSSFNWYDFSMESIDYPEFKRQFAGRVETGRDAMTDPLMGRVGVF